MIGEIPAEDHREIRRETCFPGLGVIPAASVVAFQDRALRIGHRGLPALSRDSASSPGKTPLSATVDSEPENPASEAGQTHEPQREEHP